MGSLNSFENFTGGAYGVDTLGCIVGLALGFKNHNHLRPEGNTNLSKRLRVLMVNPVIISSGSLEFSRKEINKVLNKNYKDGISANLQCRNYWQVYSADAVYCFSKKVGDKAISGGTNTALQLAIHYKKPAYVFDVESLKWFIYNDEVESLCEIDYIPELTYKYALVGTRDVEDYHVKDKDTGEWGSRPNYLGKEKEIAVIIAITELYKKALDKVRDDLDEIQA